MVTGLALSIGLTPVFIGIPLFFAVAKGIGYIVQFEQELVRSLLDIPGPSEEHRSNMQVEGAGFLQRMKLGFHAGKFARNIMLIMEFLEFTKDSRYYIIFLLAATTGMRRGEVLALRWEDVGP